MKIKNLKQLKQRDWLKICSKLGFQVNTKAGKGSHCKIINLQGHSYTISYKLNPQTNKKIYNHFVKQWGVAESDLQKLLSNA